MLALQIQENLAIKKLLDIISNFTGGNNFKKSLQTAFHLIKNTQKDDKGSKRKSESEIFLISDGITKEDVDETIKYAKQQTQDHKTKIVALEFTDSLTRNTFMKRLALSTVRKGSPFYS